MSEASNPRREGRKQQRVWAMLRRRERCISCHDLILEGGHVLYFPKTREVMCDQCGSTYEANGETE
jgi:hypothetical protein